jgi:hypothetical protein
MRVLNRLLLGAVLALAVGQPRIADATPLNLFLPETPDIFSGQIDVTYDAATDSFLADGFSLQLGVAPGTNVDILNGTFTINITTDGTTASGVGGDDLSIMGDIDLDGDSVIDLSGVLLTGEISQFGSTTSGPGVFEFVFDVTGGDLAATPLFAQPQVGVILGANGNSTFTGSFDVDFSNLSGGQAGTGTGNSDTAPIPEPGTVLLLGVGMAGLAGFGRRDRR